MDVMELTIIDYKSEHQPWFEKFNREWIEEFFTLEPLDVNVLKNPDRYILAPGGAIVMACVNNEIAGTVGLRYLEPRIFEFTKMAVDKKFRGLKIGQALAEAAIEKAKTLGAAKIILYSNTRQVPAIALYRKLGFVEIINDGLYARGNIKMELPLS
jgi:ribosomal protein S18 acetylase RimI-like enzyme